MGDIFGPDDEGGALFTPAPRLTAFERLEAAIGDLRRRPDSANTARATVEAFDAWKVARDAAPITLTEEQAWQWGTRIIGDGSVGIRALAVFVGDALRALQRGDIPAEVRTVKDDGPTPEPTKDAPSGVDRQAATSKHPECPTCAMAAKGFDVWCPHMAAATDALLKGGV